MRSLAPKNGCLLDNVFAFFHMSQADYCNDSYSNIYVLLCDFLYRDSAITIPIQLSTFTA